MSSKTTVPDAAAAPAKALKTTVAVPAGAAQARVVLSAFAGAAAASGTVVFDDIGVFDG